MAATPNPGLRFAQYAPINVSSAGDNLIVAASTVLTVAAPIVVLSYKFLVGGSVTITWYSGTHAAGTALSGPMAFGTLIFGDSGAENRFGWLSTNAGEALNLYLSAPVSVVGMITYSLGQPY